MEWAYSSNGIQIKFYEDVLSTRGEKFGTRFVSHETRNKERETNEVPFQRRENNKDRIQERQTDVDKASNSQREQRKLRETLSDIHVSSSLPPPCS